jgi:hypothetical protein
MVNHLHNSMVSTHDGSADAEATQPDGHSSPPPTLAQVFTSICESRIEQTESKFELLNCTKNQKTLFIAQQLLDDAKAWWDNFTTTRPTKKVQWAEFREAFRAL